MRAHRPFTIVLIASALLRLIVMIGYPPAMFFNDSFNYLTDAYTKTPDLVRSDGYPLFLYLLLPFHNLNVVTGLQALMGLAMGAGIYAVLRRRGLPWWGATIPALPVLFDVFELQLEHMIAADVLFYTLVVLVLVLLCWWDRPPLWVAVLVGLATGYATTVRTVGEPLLVLVLIGMLLRKMGWRRIAATAVAGVLPILGVRDLVPLIYGALRARRVEWDLPLQSRAILRRLQPHGPVGQAARALRPARAGGPPVVPGVPLVRRHAAVHADRAQQREAVHSADQLADDEVRRARDRAAAARLR